MNDDPVYIQCEHCPESTRRWEVQYGEDANADIDASLNQHIQRHHGANTDPPWEHGEDFLVLTFAETVEEDVLLAQFQHQPQKSNVQGEPS
jgi:hypothetical protein